MRSSLALVLSLLVLAPCAHAQTTAQDSCETVTTVRCTGSASPLALRPAPVQVAPVPAPAPVQVLPPVPAPPDEGCVECAAPRAATPPMILPSVIGGGWRLEMNGNGTTAYVRSKKTPNAGVWAPGLALWLGSYVTSMAVGISRDGNFYTAIPIFGALGTGIASGLFGDSPGATAGYTLAGLGQIAGMVTFIVGMAAGPEKLEKMPVQIGPMATKDGGGLSLAMKF